MKKLGFCFVWVFLFLFDFEVSCFAQSNNHTQLIVGTWKSTDNEETLIYTFNANGTFSFSSTNTIHPDWNDRYSGNYFMTNSDDTKIFFKIPSNSYSSAFSINVILMVTGMKSNKINF